MPKDTPHSKVREAVLEYLATAAEGVPQVAVAKISSKNQITLPVAMVRRLGLEPGRKLMLRLEDDRIILRPEPEDWVEYFRGSMKGVYGKTVEEMDEYVRKERASWRRRADSNDS
ncbi:MAG TPA: AbrB/MazE/SpoVT family DNA-binding domain-containing protein [Dehalococcoidia bacterium]|nr:AbrB/MazE/SpoVT family DNA-binding domain-containing protein [Dehalococcoidia bacterium]